MNHESKGKRAAEILKDEVFLEAEAIARAKLMQQWETESDQSKRDALWHQVQALRATRVALEVLVSRGTIAGHQVQQESRVQ